MSTLEDMVEVLQGYAFAPGSPERRQKAAGSMIAAGVDPEGAERLFAHLEATAARADIVPRLVAAFILDPARINPALRELEAAEAKKAERAAKRKKPYPGEVDFQHPTGSDEPEQPRPRTELPEWASPQSTATAAGLKVQAAADTEELHRQRTERFTADMRKRKEERR